MKLRWMAMTDEAQHMRVALQREMARMRVTLQKVEPEVTLLAGTPFGFWRSTADCGYDRQHRSILGVQL
jgi:hypothetical protein